MNEGDCFVLDDVRMVYTWFGKDCSAFEKYEANRAAQKMADSWHGHTYVVQDVGEDNEEFWELLGRRGAVKEVSKVKDDKMPGEEQTKVFKVSEEDGKIEMTDLEQKKAVWTQRL
eukprot:2532099-Ditylum_brightwellii.AAC.1